MILQQDRDGCSTSELSAVVERNRQRLIKATEVYGTNNKESCEYMEA